MEQLATHLHIKEGIRAQENSLEFDPNVSTINMVEVDSFLRIPSVKGRVILTISPITKRTKVLKLIVGNLVKKAT